jgi:hypothetical protein
MKKKKEREGETFFLFLHRMRTENNGWENAMGIRSKWIGVSVVAFGCGILVAFFVPESVLIVLEAGVIVTSGILFSKC